MSAEPDSVEIVLERGNKDQKDQKGLGFNIKGGVDAPHLEEDTGIFVTKIRETGAAAESKTLKEGDKILELNGQSLIEIKHAEAVNYFRNSGNTVKLKIIPGMEEYIMSRRAPIKGPSSAPSSNDSCRYWWLGASLATLGAAVLVILYMKRQSAH